MKKKARAAVIPEPDLGLPEEPPLDPEEAAEAVREVHRVAGRPAPPEADDDQNHVAEPEPPIPWGPLRPDEIPS